MDSEPEVDAGDGICGRQFCRIRGFPADKVTAVAGETIGKSRERESLRTDAVSYGRGEEIQMNRAEARKRAEELVARMTLEERASQLRFDAPPVKRLGIEAYNWWNEALHGVARAGQATVFPQAIGLAASFDVELLREIGAAAGLEGRAKYNAYSSCGDRDIYKGLTFWAPNVNIFRDPRWGRGHETYGEDPFLTGELGKAFVEGLQGDGEVMQAAACAKHFAVHSGPEELRHEFDARVSGKDLEETYLPAFEMLVRDGGVEAVMGAYNRVNGEPCCGSPALLDDILRKRWGFAGHVVSDCGAILDFHENHMVTATPQESAALAINAGCDLNCGATYLHILSAYQQGLVTEETITEAAVRLFTTRYLLGLPDGSAYDAVPYEVVECREHLALAGRAAAESFVLLKNNGILPLDKSRLKTIGVIGPNADSRVALVGNYHGTASSYVTVQEGIVKYAGDSVRVLTSVGCGLCQEKVEFLSQGPDRLAEARIVAEHSDVVILCLGLDETLEGEEGDAGNSYASGDKENLLLPESQRLLMETVAAAGKPVVLCMMAGSDIDMGYAQEHFDAILQMWYPGGQGGTAAANVLFGEISPSGKLPVTFYETYEELPEFTDYAMEGRTYRYLKGKAQYPFGFGLTYGKAKVLSARVEPVNVEHGKEVPVEPETGGEFSAVSGKSGWESSEYRVCARVKNEGERDTEDVLQIYIRKADSVHDTPHPSLCAFCRVALREGEEREVSLPVPERAFTVVDDAGRRFVDGTCFQLFAGFSQPDKRSVELTGEAPVELTVYRKARSEE